MNLLQMSFCGGVFILIVAVIRVLAVNKLPKMTFLILWEIALLRLLLPVTLRVPFSVYSIAGRSIPVLDTFERGITNFNVGALPDQPGGVENEAAQIVQDAAHSTPVFSIIWVIGMAVVAGIFIVSYLRCRCEFRTALPVQNDFTALWLHGHSAWRTIDIRQLAGLSTPLTYGVFHPVILVPKDMDWRDERQAQYVLFHEYVHIRRFDAVVKLIASAALCIHWFNPLVWVLCVLLNRDIELSCDECVIRHFGEKDRRAYAMTLIRMEEQRSNPAPFGNYFNRNTTEERVKAIMKFRKKTGVALAFAVIIAGVGAVTAFAMSNTDIGAIARADFGDVLRGEDQFLYVSGEGIESRSIYDVPALFDPDDTYMTTIWNFAVQDLDGDENAEIVLFVCGMAGDMGGKLILHQMDDKVYGYTIDNSTLTGLKEDGTYSYSDPTGAIEGGICSISGFSETGIIIDKFTYGHGTYEGWDTFVVNHQAATEEEFLAAENGQAGKPDAVWYDFTAENIKAVFGGSAD